MILAQIEEWFHAGLAGIRQPRGSIAYRSWSSNPSVVGDLTFVKGSYRDAARRSRVGVDPQDGTGSG